MKILTVFFSFFILACAATASLMVLAHECSHDKMKDLPGYGKNSPVIEGIKYEFHDDQIFKDYLYKLTHKNGPSRHPHLRNKNDDHKKPHKMRVADVLTVNPSATTGNMRFKVFFDQATCPGAGCGHCQSVGQTVETFEGGATATCRQEDVLTTAKKSYIMDVLMPRAMEFLSNALRINPVVGNLVVSPGGTCGSSPGTPIPSSHSSTGVADADFIIYVTAAPKSDSSSQTVAWALSCRDDGSGRPVVAHVNWVPSRLENADTLDGISTQSDALTGIHEIAHALSFSNPFFGGSGYYDDSYNFQSGGTTTTSSSAPFNKARTFITSTRVVREVRDFFNCSTAIGAEIEDQGGSGTANSHFEKRIFSQHTMAGIGTTVISHPSRLLLAYFEDTGHYIANYSVVSYDKHFINFGRGKGCSFLEEKCDSTTNKNSGEYCFTTDRDNKVCTFDGLSIGYCSASAFGSAVPSNMQYFTDPNTGSSVQLDDFCPNALFYSNQRCVDPSATSSSKNGVDVFGATSRCFQSNLADTSSSSIFSGSSGSSSSSSTSQTDARCIETICNSDGSMSLIVSLRKVDCPSDGSAGKADLSGLSGFTGEINCPPAARYCPPGNGSLPILTPSTASDSKTTKDGFAPAYAGPVEAACSDRRACALAAFDKYMPACREVAFEVSRCFGTDCDTVMQAFITDFGANGLGLYYNCTNGKGGFSEYCQEGRVGANALCGLASAGKLMMSGMIMIVGMMLCLLL